MQTQGVFSVPEIHKDFSLDQQSHTIESLKSIAEIYCNEEEIYKQDLGRFILDWCSDKDHIVVKTSGSTGTPKKMKVFKQHMINSAMATGKFFKTEEKSTALLCLPTTYIAGKMMLVRAMILGWKLDVISPKTNPLDIVNIHYDFCAMVPMQLENSIDQLHLIKKLIVGGGAVSESLKKQIQGVKTKIYETYGMTETVTHIAARRINPRKKDKKEKICFKALPNIILSIDDRNCLIIKAPLLNNELIVTNDVVELTTDKKFHWKGRYDNVINSGGIKLFPEEIETKLQILISNRFFITSIPDDVLGNKVVLLVERAYDSVHKESLLKDIRDQKVLLKHEIPKSIYFVSKFIETETGKVKRSSTLEFALTNS